MILGGSLFVFSLSQLGMHSLAVCSNPLLGNTVVPNATRLPLFPCVFWGMILANKLTIPKSMSLDLPLGDPR